MGTEYDWGDWDGITLEDTGDSALVQVTAGYVKVGVNADGTGAVVALDADQARALAEVLLAAANDADANTPQAE